LKSVCVVGGGMAGLAAARELRREGHVVTVMEQCSDVGGQWLYDPRTDVVDPLGAAAPVHVPSSMYACLRLVSPREAMGFSDFQFESTRILILVETFWFLATTALVGRRWIWIRADPSRRSAIE
jgi:cation diffusion facilitator CzcD-associated flavoprotein CzcO